MNQIMKNLNNHHKTSSDYISKQKIKNQMTSSAVIFKSNVMNIKINNISNSKDGYIFIPNSKVIIGRSFDKELQDNKKMIKKYLKKEKTQKDSQKNSLELESKDEVSTNNLTESLQYYTDINLNGKGNINISSSNNCNYNNYINNNIYKKISTINARSTNSNYIPTISINIKKKDNENRLKANIDIKAKVKNKKCLNINNSNIIKKNNNNNISNSNINGNKINETFNKAIISKDSFDNKIYKKNIHNSYNKEKIKNGSAQNKEICQTKRKISNITEDNIKNSLLPSKCKTQNYINNINKINTNIHSNYYSNRKIIINSKDNFNNSYENNENNSINHLINSKKKLNIKSSENKDSKEKKNNNKENKCNKDKEMSNIKKNKIKNKNMVNNIKLKQKNVLLLKSISVAQKLLRSKSPMNKNTITLNHANYFDNSNTINQESTYKDFYTMKNNTDRKKEDNNNKSKKNIINNINKNNNTNKNTYLNKNQNDKKVSKTSQKYTLLKKNESTKLQNNENNKNGNVNGNGNGNIIIAKKKKSSHNNVVNINSSNKKIKIETSFDENNGIRSKNQKDIISFQNSTPIINKVLVFEIGNSQIFNNISSNDNNSNNNLNNSNNNNHSYKNIIHKDKLKNNKNNLLFNNENTPKKNNITEIIKKNIEYNKGNKNAKIINNNKRTNNCVNDSYSRDNTLTSIENNRGFMKNKKVLEKKSQKINMSGNNIIKLSDYKKKTENNNTNEIDKNFGDMETPILLNTPKLTGRIIDVKLNIFEKIKNLNNNKEIIKKPPKKPKNIKEENSTETEEIIFQEGGTLSSNKNTLNNMRQNNKNKSEIKLKHKKLKNKDFSNILLLNEDCFKTLFNFFDLTMLNTFTLLNKKYHNCFKKIISQKIKDKIIDFYSKNIDKYNNNIKLNLMKISPLSKISPLLLHKKYIDLLLENNNKYDKEIQKDLTRTFPDNSSFKYGNPNYNKLYHLLTVYSLYNNKIGYAQGINFLVAHIILLFDKEEEAFVFLDALLQKFEFEKLLGLENELHNKLNNIGQYLNKHCPEICKYLDGMKLNHEFFTTNWMITLFSNSMEEKYLFIIWDFLIIYGRKFFRYFLVSVLNTYKKNIMEEKQNKLTYFMKNLLRNDKFKQKFQEIINKTFELMIKDKEIN